MYIYKIEPSIDMRYKVLTEDISNLKANMWRLVYYHLLFNSGLIAYAGLITDHHFMKVEKGLLISIPFVSLISTILSILITASYYKALKQYRNDMDRIVHGCISNKYKYRYDNILFGFIFYGVPSVTCFGVIRFLHIYMMHSHIIR